MSDLISRQAAIDSFDGVKVDEENCTEYDIGYNDGIDFAVSILSVLPSAQPKQKRGKWIIHHEVKNIYGGTYIECSECGEKYVVQHIEDEKFCRNCGAYMRGEEDEIDRCG